MEFAFFSCKILSSLTEPQVISKSWCCCCFRAMFNFCFQFSAWHGFLAPQWNIFLRGIVRRERKHCAKKPVTTMLTYPWKCCPNASEGDNQSVGSSAPVVSRCFPGGYNVKLYISRGRLAWWLLAFLCCEMCRK